MLPLRADPQFPQQVMQLRLPSPLVLVMTALGLVLQWLLCTVYVHVIAGYFTGSHLGGSSGGSEIPISYLMTAAATATCALYCEGRAGPSRVIVIIQLVAIVIPLQSLLAAHFELAQPEFAAAVGLAYIGSLAFAGVMPDLRLPVMGTAPRVMLLIFAGLVSAYVYVTSIASGALTHLSFNLATVYEVREEFFEHPAPLLGYLVPWQGYVLNPALMLIALARRSLVLGAVGLAMQLLLFGMTGFRAFLFLPLLLLAVYLAGRRRNLMAAALVGLLALIVVALSLYAWLDEPLIPALLIDRVIVIPAEVHYWYYDYFGIHRQAPLQLSQSLFSFLSTSHYSAPVPEVIGWRYLGSAASANVGLFGDAFANFGFAGCGIFALLFALILKAIDAAADATDMRVAAALVAMPAFELVNSGLLTTLLTHGLALTIIVLWAFGSRARGTEAAGARG